MTPITARAPIRPLWWLHPFWFMAAPLLFMSAIAYLLPEGDYHDAWLTPKAFEFGDLVLCFAVAGVFSAGCLIASRLNAVFSHRHPLSPGARDAGVGRRELELLFDLAFIVTIVGYAIWFASIIRQGGLGLFLNMLSGGKGASDEAKRSATDSMITGVTTFTQFGMGTTLLGTYLGLARGWGTIRIRLVLLLGMTALRAVFLSERLSLIEVLLPSLIVAIRLKGFGRAGSKLRRLLVITPAMAVVGLYALFTFTEYFRSWSTFYADRGDQSLLSFSMLRLLGYYVTAINNGAIEWHAHGALHFPYETLDWLWRFPVVGESLQTMLGGNKDPALVRVALLTAEGNPEFNNTSGVFTVFTDFGAIGAMFFFLLYGCGAGLLHRSYCRGSTAGLFLYPFLVVALSEQMLIFYAGSGRAFPTWLLLFAAVFAAYPRRGRVRPPQKRGQQPATRAGVTRR